MRSQIYNYSIRYLNAEGPKQSNLWVHKALTAQSENWLQVAFVDSVHALGGRCHGFGPWNPCPVKALQEGEIIHVEFNTGWWAGTVLSHDSESSVLIRFHTDSTRFHVRDKHHTFSLHPPAITGPDPPPISAHAQLAPPLCSLPAPLPPYPIPHRCSPIGETEEGFLFQYHERLPPLQVSDFCAWGCLSVASAVEHTHSDHWLWVYIDGSWDDPLAGSAAVFVWPDGTVIVLAIPCPYRSSKDSEFRAFTQTLRYLRSIGFQGTVFVCIDNSQVVNCVDWRQSGTPLPPASMSTQGTWQRLVDDLISSCGFHLEAGWLKSHVGFPGNELADSFAKYSAYACIVTHFHLQHPTRHSVTFDGYPCIHKFSGSRRRQLYPRHDHTGIVTRFSFDWSTHYSWFSSFADKWVMGVKGVYGASPFWDLSDRKCPDCDGQHPLDLTSCVAFCSTFSTHRARMFDSWGPNVAPQVQRWIQGLRTKGELRNFARTLIPVSLYEALTVDSSGKRHLHDALAPRRKALISVIKDVCSHRREHPLPDPLPPPLNPNTFFTSHGP